MRRRGGEILVGVGNQSWGMEQHTLDIIASLNLTLEKSPFAMMAPVRRRKSTRNCSQAMEKCPHTSDICSSGILS